MTTSVSVQQAFSGFKLDISFEAPAGLTVLYGRSGSGKTTVINAVAGLMKPDSARISVDGTVLHDTAKGIWVSPHKRQIGYIFQDARLFPHMTVRQNLTYGQRRSKVSDDRPNFEKIADLLGLEHLLSRRPAHLSGGEKQRVAIGRALLSSPKLLLADEPLAALDDPRKAEILPYFERLRDEAKIPILYVSHAATEVARLATTVVVLDQGGIVMQGPPEEVMANPSVLPTGVRGAGALLTALVVAHHDDGLTELNAGGVPLLVPEIAMAIGCKIRVRVAAHDVILSTKPPVALSALNIIPGTIEKIRKGDGPGAIVTLLSPAGLILARITRRSLSGLELVKGMQCYAVIKTVAIAPEDVGNTSLKPLSLADDTVT
ncbi:MAG: molybdenum ABC transporter ATP-binding protein [Pseudoruegeria sp.]